MKLISRVLIACLALAVALCVVVSPASAAAKKKKEVMVVKHHHNEGEKPHPINGLNIYGKPGYFFSDTAETFQKSQIAGAAHLTFDTNGNVLNIPVGGSYGITDKILVNVNTNFYSFGGYSQTINGITVNGGGGSGLGYLSFGGKYGFGNVLKDSDSNLKIAAGLDLSIGPLSNNGGTVEFGFDPYGVATWTLPDGLQFNGRLGVFITSFNATTYDPITGQNVSTSVGYSYWQLDLGAAYPFDPNLTGIAELATNGVYGLGTTSGGTPLLVGIRTGHEVQLQAMAGLDLGGQVGLYIGGGVALFSM